MNPLMNVATLADLLASGKRTVLLDVRWKLGDPHGREHYLAGHLPGAVYVDLDTELAGHGVPADGRHPLPGQDDFEAAVRRWGISAGDTVVAYDDAGATAAARAWWLLDHGGLGPVYLLDGGLAAWREAGLPLDTGDVVPEPGDAVVRYGGREVADIAAAGRWPEHGVLLDARAGERYRGETEPVDPRAGHIPGAVSAPTSGNLGADGKFLPAAELAARFTALGVSAQTDVAVYCGSGVTAAHEIAALQVAGYRAALFPGSWSAWSNRPDRPVATGNEPPAHPDSPGHDAGSDPAGSHHSASDQAGRDEE